jgi:hypothetical protein
MDLITSEYITVWLTSPGSPRESLHGHMVIHWADWGTQGLKVEANAEGARHLGRSGGMHPRENFEI